MSCTKLSREARFQKMFLLSSGKQVFLLHVVIVSQIKFCFIYLLYSSYQITFSKFYQSYSFIETNFPNIRHCFGVTIFSNTVLTILQNMYLVFTRLTLVKHPCFNLKTMLLLSRIIQHRRKIGLNPSKPINLTLILFPKKIKTYRPLRECTLFSLLKEQQ